MGAHRLVYIVVGVDINTAHQLDELTRFRLAVGAGFIDVFTDEMEGHMCNFRAFQIRESYNIFLRFQSPCHYRVFQIRDSDIRRYC